MAELEEEVQDQIEEVKKSTKFKLDDYLGDESSEFFNKHKMLISITGGILAILLIGWFSYSILYQHFIVTPNNEKSIELIWRQEAAGFDREDWHSMINGDSLQTFKSLKHVIKEYGGYQGGKLAVYDLGIAYLNNEQYDEAIKTLKDVDFDDEIIATIALGAIGDAYMQNGNVTDAFNYYEKAYKRRDNELTTPMFMMKAAFSKEMEEKYDAAKLIYQEIIYKYQNSPLSIKAEKYLESLKLGAPVYQIK